ncbi:MAG: glycosyltransferase [Chitinophagaceae bacterium]
MIIINRLVIGGVAINSLEVIKALKSEFHLILVTGSRNEDEFELPVTGEYSGNYELVRIPGLQRSINPLNDLKALLSLRSLILERKPSIVHTIGAKPGFLGRLAAKLCRVPIIIHAYHGHVFSAYFNPLLSAIVVGLEKLSARWTTAIISVSKKQIVELAEKYHIASKEKMFYLPIGINHQNFHDETGKKRAAFRQKYLLDDDEIAIGIIGRIVPVKDHVFFLDIVQRTIHRNSKIRYFVIGDGEKLRLKLEQLAAEKGIDFTYFPKHPRKAFLTFTSWLSQMDVVMAGLDIISLTSKNEGTPLSIIEAGLMAKPVVATDVGAVDEVMLPGITGYIIKHGDLDRFVTRLLSLTEDSSLRRKMGSEGKRYATGRFGIEKQVKATRDLYNALLEKLPD